jgi:hypothetical protein
MPKGSCGQRVDASAERCITRRTTAFDRTEDPIVPNLVSLMPLRKEVIRCVECERRAETSAGWKLYLGAGYEDERVEVLVYCPSCVDQEFGHIG